MWLLKGSTLINMDNLLGIHIEKDYKGQKYFLVAAGQKREYHLETFTDVDQADLALQRLVKLTKAYQIPKEMEK